MIEAAIESWRALGYCDRTMDEAVAQWEESVAGWALDRSEFNAAFRYVCRDDD